MPSSRSKESARKRSVTTGDKRLSSITKKQIDSLPSHAQHIYKKTHDSAIEQYQDPEKRRGGRRQNAEEVAHKAAWAAVKRDYTKKGSKWVKKEE
jgi:cation transport regulator